MDMECHGFELFRNGYLDSFECQIVENKILEKFTAVAFSLQCPCLPGITRYMSTIVSYIIYEY